MTPVKNKKIGAFTITMWIIVPSVIILVIWKWTGHDFPWEGWF